MNGVYLRELPREEFAHRLVLWLGENGYDWDAERVAQAAPLVQEKIARLAEFPGFAGFLFGDVEPDPTDLDGGAPMLAATRGGARLARAVRGCRDRGGAAGDGGRRSA